MTTDAPLARIQAQSSYRVLAEAQFFADLNAEQLRRLAALAEIHTYSRHDAIYGIGDRARDFYVLVDGQVRFTIGLGNRQARGGEILRRGEMFGWAALIERVQRRIATAYCLTACTALAIDGCRCLQLMESDTDLGYHVMRQLNWLVTTQLTAFVSG